MIACLVNFSARLRPDHRIGLPEEGVWKEILNTDASPYDGSGEFGEPRPGGGETGAIAWASDIGTGHYPPAGSGLAAVRARTCRGAAGA